MADVQLDHVERELPAPTADVEEAKRDMDFHRCAMMRRLISPPELAALRDRATTRTSSCPSCRNYAMTAPLSLSLPTRWSKNADWSSDDEP